MLEHSHHIFGYCEILQKKNFESLITFPTRLSTKNSLSDHIYTNENNITADRNLFMSKNDINVTSEKRIVKNLNKALDHFPVLCRIGQ